MPSISDQMASLAAGGGKKHGISERFAGSEEGAKPPARGGEEGVHTQLHDHGDGTYHSITSDGEKTEHPSLGHALVHIASKHDGESKHMHISKGEDGGHTSHQASGGGVEGPHDHENIEKLKEHLDQFFTEEENEGSEYKGASKGAEESLFD